MASVERIFLGYPVTVLSPRAGTETTRYALHPLNLEHVEGVTETLSLQLKTLSLTTFYPLTFEPGTPKHHRDATHRNSLGGATIVLVGWDDGTLGGPYRVTDYDVRGPEARVQVNAQVAPDFDDLVELATVPEGDDISPWVDALALTPWSTWQADGFGISNTMRGSAINAKDSGSLFAALEQWGLTVIPTTTVTYERLSGGESLSPQDTPESGFLFSYSVGVTYVTKYPPSDVNSRLQDTRQHVWREDAAGDLYITSRGQGRPVLQTLRDAAIGDDLDIPTPDAFNGIGAWRTRRIAIEIEAPLGDPRILYESGTDEPALYVPVAEIQEIPSQIVIDLARWGLQNESTTAGAALYPADLSIVAGQVVTFVDSGERLDGQAWRVTQVEHTTAGDDVSRTVLDLTSYQGAFSRISLT